MGKIIPHSNPVSNKVNLEIIFQAYGASHEDFGIILHMDREPHHIMNYAKDFDRLPILEQEGLALLVSDLGTLLFYQIEP